MATGKKKTIVLLPFDAHGHTNAMISLAGELKSLGHRTVFICFNLATPRRFGHELILLEDRYKGKQEDQSSLKDATESEEEVFFTSKKFDHNWSKEDNLNIETGIEEGPHISSETVETMVKNYKMMVASVGDLLMTDKILENIIIDLKPDLAVIEYFPKAAIMRLADDSYAKSVANWSKGLRWMTLSTINPLSLYYFAQKAGRLTTTEESKPTVVPVPFFGLPVKSKLDQPTKEELRSRDEIFDHILESTGYIEAYKLNRKLDDIPTLLLNESPWLNVYMFPGELDYADQIGCRFDESLWMRVDSLIRPSTTPMIGSLDFGAIELLDRLASWKASPQDSIRRTVIYVSLGTIMSENIEIMRLIMQQVFACLQRKPQWYFAIALGINHAGLMTEFADQLEYWQHEEDRLLAKGWWPQPEVFRRQLADACVIHGGNNTICELFHYFSPPPPLVVVPGIGDQLDNARRIEELGFGLPLATRSLLQETSDTLLLDALERSINLDRSSLRENNQKDHLDAHYCARQVLRKLESEEYSDQVTE